MDVYVSNCLFTLLQFHSFSAAVKDSGNIAEIILIQGSKYFTPLESNFPSLVSSCCVLNVLMSADNEKKLKFQKNGNIL